MCESLKSNETENKIRKFSEFQETRIYFTH